VALAGALRAIAQPRRLEILRLVRDREVPAGEIAARFEVSRPAISQHLAVLKGAGLLVERRDGTRRLYRSRPEGLVELRAYLNGFWGNSLTELKRIAEAEVGARSRQRARRR
jgi:DNA-binding transcriptional ArsR family regulator